MTMIYIAFAVCVLLTVAVAAILLRNIKNQAAANLSAAEKDKSSALERAEQAKLQALQDAAIKHQLELSDAKAATAKAEESAANLKVRIEELKGDLSQLQTDKDTLLQDKSDLSGNLKSAQELLKAAHEQAKRDEESRAEKLKTEIELAREQMRGQFEKEMESRTASLKQANTEQMQLVVGPLQKELEGLRSLVSASKEEHLKETTSLKSSIEAMFAHDQERDKTTLQLANALKNRGKVQGDWGEQVLENILRDSNLREGQEYRVQFSAKDEDGNNRRPDVIVNCPDGSCIVIDSKVSLTAYTEYVSADTEEEKKAADKANYDSIWQHVEELADKKYTQLVQNAVPTALMFVPNEGSYILAMNRDPQLGQKAYKKGVLIVNPTNLMMVLQLILITWQNTRQEQTNKEILKKAGEIYEKYATFAETFVKLGNNLNTARNTYETGLGQLKEGKGNLSGKIEGLLKLGAAPNKRIPEAIASVNDADDAALPMPSSVE